MRINEKDIIREVKFTVAKNAFEGPFNCHNKKIIEIERKINFDGKTFFLRFPKEITKNWHKGSTADIKVLGTDEFLVKVKI